MFSCGTLECLFSYWLSGDESVVSPQVNSSTLVAKWTSAAHSISGWVGWEHATSVNLPMPVQCLASVSMCERGTRPQGSWRCRTTQTPQCGCDGYVMWSPAPPGWLRSHRGTRMHREAHLRLLIVGSRWQTDAGSLSARWALLKPLRVSLGLWASWLSLLWFF